MATAALEIGTLYKKERSYANSWLRHWL